MAKLPLKARMLQYIVKKGTPVTVDDIMNDLAEEYKGEKLFNRKLIEEYFDALIGVGFLKNEKLDFNDKDELVVYATATEYGKDRSRFIPEK